MYAIVDIAGQQMKVQKNGKLFVHRLKGEVGSEVEFNKVLLIENDGKVTVGNPVIEGAVVSARILEHLKGDKVLVFKKKRRKGYKVLNGHRQFFTQIEIEDILESGAGKKASREKEVKAEVTSEPMEPETTSVTGSEEVEATPVKPRRTAKPKVQGESAASTEPAENAESKSPKPRAKKSTKPANKESENTNE